MSQRQNKSAPKRKTASTSTALESIAQTDQQEAPQQEHQETSKSKKEIALQNKLQRIQDILNHYYPDPPIPLNHSNSFTFLVAVVLSAQTTDGKVNEVTKVLFQDHGADNPLTLSKLDVSLVESIIKPVGLAPQKVSFMSLYST
jgi:hypothetical protein